MTGSRRTGSPCWSPSRRCIYDELVHGRVPASARETMRRAAAAVVAAGADVVVAGCTEIELALAPADVDVPLVATTDGLVAAAVAWLLDGQLPPRPRTG